MSVVDLTVRTTKETSYKEICEAMKRASETYLKGILGWTADEVVRLEATRNVPSLTLVAPDPDFVYRPLAVAEPAQLLQPS